MIDNMVSVYENLYPNIEYFLISEKEIPSEKIDRLFLKKGQHRAVNKKLYFGDLFK